jgi:SAM-dependent methyltransferase
MATASSQLPHHSLREARASILSLARVTVNRVLSPLGIEIIRRRGHDWGDTRTFLPFEQTIASAARRGLSLNDYIDEVINKIPGATQATIDGMKNLGVFARPIHSVVEIGPGSGRYLEKTLAQCAPERYEVYETAIPWAAYVRDKYHVVLQPTDGRTLSSTFDESADLVQAHKVFCGIPALPTFRYWAEMARVCRSDGHAVFDIVTEDCLDLDALRDWIGSSTEYGPYPATIPRRTAIEYFASRRFDLVGTFFIPLGTGRTEVFVFRKR